MAAFIVDANVALKWFLPEEHDAEALALLGHDLIAPELLWIEAANVLAAKVVSGRIHRGLLDRAPGLLDLAIATRVQDHELISAAQALSVELRHPIYDCLYLALLDRHDAVLVTADGRLLRALGDHRLRRRTRRLGATE